MPPTKKVILLLHEEAVRWLRDESYRTGLSRSEIVRRLIDGTRLPPPEPELAPPGRQIHIVEPERSKNTNGKGLWWTRRDK